MDLQNFIQELKKIGKVDQQLLTKLSEITLNLNNWDNKFITNNKEKLILLIQTLQNYLCHDLYQDYLNQKSKNNSVQYNQNLENKNNHSIYDNSMNLILVILSRISKLDKIFGKCLVDCFIDHIRVHHECFNYIISFYRLYINNQNLQSAGKELLLYNNLFELYKRIYIISTKYESKSLNNLNNLGKFSMINDSKYFLENFKNQRYKNEVKRNLTLTMSNLSNERESNKFKNNSERTEEININNKTQSFIKKKIPELKFPVNNLDHFTLSRSSQRGSSTNHTKVIKTHSKQISNKIIDQLSSMNRQDENFTSPIQKLKTLAFQLGESCLAADLASLIYQKRDFELGKLAKENVSKKISPLTSTDNKRSENNSIGYIDRLKNNQNFENENIIINTNNSNCEFNKNFIFSTNNENNENIIDKTYKNFIKIREILTNFILSCINEFSLDEYQLLKININLIYSYFMLNSFDQIRKKSEIKKFENISSNLQILCKNFVCEGSYNIIKNQHNILNEKSYNNNIKLSREKTTFDNNFNFNFESEKSNNLSLKSEYEALHEILNINSTSIENIIKQQNFYNNIFYSLENPEPESNEFWSNGILFKNFLNLNQIRKHSDLFLDRIKNRISFILKNYSMINNQNIFKMIKQQLDILKEYLNQSKSKIITIHFIFEFSEILIILKKNFIEIFNKFSVFEINKNELKFIENCDFSELEISDDLIDLFISYLDLLSNLIINVDVFTSEKMINDIFILSPDMNEILKFLIIYIFNKDLYNSNGIGNKSENNSSYRNSIKSTNLKLNLLNFAKESDTFDNKIIENFKDYLYKSLHIINYLNNSTIFYHKIIKKENLENSKNEEKEMNKYWVNSIREFLKFINYFMNTKFGIFFEYIQNYGSFINISNNDYIQLTKSLLNLHNSIFNFNHKFSFILNENSSLDFIRIHYISFIKLYNKNLDFKTKLGDMSKIIEHSEKEKRKKKVRELIRNIYKDQSNLEVIIDLCKLHLMCLFSMAKNRNLDVTNKFFQLRIVDFMSKELNLEYEAAERMFKIKSYLDGSNSNNQINKINKIIPSNELLNIKESILEGEDELSKLSNNKNITFNNFNNEKDRQNNYISKDDLSDEDLSDYDSDDLSDIMLVDLKPKHNLYEDKIPKLSLIPTTFSNDTFGGNNNNNNVTNPQVKKPNLKLTFLPLDTLNTLDSLGEKKKLNFINLNKNNNNQNNLLTLNKNTEKDSNEFTEEDNTKIKDTELFITPNQITNLKKTIGIKNDINNENLTVTPNHSAQSVFISRNDSQSALKSENVKLIIKDKEELINTKKTVSVLDLKSIPSSQNKTKLDSTIPKLNLRTIYTNKEDDKDKDRDVINYAGNKGKINLSIPKLNISNSVNQSQNDNFICSEMKKESSEEIQNLEKTLNDQHTSKIQVAFENMLKKKYNLFYKKATMEELKEEDLRDINLFYMKERNNRLLYQDTELQVIIISIVMCLIITPTRGLLDELYTSYYPTYESNKMNILFLLHHHLNHKDNQEIIPTLFNHMSEINPTGAGQRLMKLLCQSLFDVRTYKDWNKIGSGAYASVYECSTGLAEPRTVAIKKIGVAESIYDFCHLFDIFSEITALETFRMEGCVTHLFDYGVDKEYYYIIMKRYQMSLKEWRLQQNPNKDNILTDEMLPIYLNIFRDILKAIHTIHNHKTTHYDLKCDNICIDLNSNNLDIQKVNSSLNDLDGIISVKIADFGECKMFLSEKDEYCMRSRGTNVIKSPEMLKNYGIQIRTDDDNYDRRRKTGTTRSSDIWSLGCLFYELLTGKFLFEEIESDYFGFMYKSNTMSINELLNEDKLKWINSNPYLVDFLKFVLVKDMNYRPNIETIMKRFEHVHALLVSNGITHHTGINSQINLKKINDNYNIDNTIEICKEMITKTNNNINITNELKLKCIPSLLKITEEIYLSEFSYSENNFDKLYKLGITHIISWTRTKNNETEKIFYLNILENENEYKKAIYSHVFKVMDFLRHAMIYRGKVLFIDDFNYFNKDKPNYLMRSLIIISFSYMLNLSAYDTWTFINSKLLFFHIPFEILSDLSNWVINQSQITNFVFSNPFVKCLCGACVIAMKRSFSNLNLMNVKSCSCSGKHNNVEYSECPSNGCYDYIQDIKKSYGITYDSLQWASFTQDDFIIGPIDNPNSFVKIIVPLSRGLEDNLIQHSVNEKKSNKLNQKKLIWVVYKCRICQVWMYGENIERFQLLINNINNFSKKSEQKKILIKSTHLKNLKLAKII